MIRIYSSKVDRQHAQYVTPAFCARLQERWSELAVRSELCPYVVSYKGEPVASLKRAFATAKRRAGITKKVRLYDIRHFYVSHAMARGANPVEIASRIGTSIEMIHTVYTHLADEIRSREALSIPDLYRKELPAPVDTIP